MTTPTTARPMRVPPRALQNRFRTGAPPPTDSDGEIRITCHDVSVIADKRDEVFGRKDTSRGEAAFTSLLRAFWKRGVDLQVDPHTREHYAGIARWKWSASQHGIQYRVETGINLGVDVTPIERIAGDGELSNLPHGVRSRLLVALAAGARALMALGYAAPPELRDAPITAWAIDRYLASRPHCDQNAADGHAYFRGHNFDRDANGWPGIDCLARSCWGVTDADGVRLAQGVVRYAYDHHGHLVRGAVHGGVNGQWMLLPDPARASAWTTPVRYALWYGSAKELFSWRVDRQPVRHRALDAKGREERLVKEIRKALDAKQYRRAVVLSAELERRFPTPAARLHDPRHRTAGR